MLPWLGKSVEKRFNASPWKLCKSPQYKCTTLQYYVVISWLASCSDAQHSDWGRQMWQNKAAATKEKCCTDLMKLQISLSECDLIWKKIIVSSKCQTKSKQPNLMLNILLFLTYRNFCRHQVSLSVHRSATVIEIRKFPCNLIFGIISSSVVLKSSF